MPMQSEYKELGLAARPFVTYTLQPHHRSALVNTNSHGFREHRAPDGAPVDFRELRSRYDRCRVLLGGSVAFGIGASGDGTTMAAVISRPDLPMINLGVSGAGTQQELAYFLALHHLLPPVHDVVLFSGFNEFVHAALKAAEVYPEFGGTVLGPQRLPEAPAGRRGTDEAEEWSRTEVEDNLRDPETVEARLSTILDRAVHNLQLWRVLQDGLDMRVHYVLQPAMGWTPKVLTADEQQAWEIDRVQLGAAARWLATPGTYERARAAFGKGAADAGIRFYDASEWLSTGYDDTTVFIDVAHFGDAGQRVMATEMGRRIDWAVS